jgi:hypothetical protein
MDLHNLCFSIWYHNMLQNRVTKIKYIDSTRLLIFLHSFIDTLYHLLIKKKERAEIFTSSERIVWRIIFDYLSTYFKALL